MPRLDSSLSLSLSLSLNVCFFQMCCCSTWLLNLLILLLANVRWVINAKYAACAWTIHIFSGNVSIPSLSLSLSHLFPWMWNNQLTERPLFNYVWKVLYKYMLQPPLPTVWGSTGWESQSSRLWTGLIISHFSFLMFLRESCCNLCCKCELGCSQENLVVWSISGWELLQVSLVSCDLHHGGASLHGWRWDR
jgi:hypothetical protein